MVDVVSPAKRSEMMAGIRSRNTKPEVLVRKLLHGAGYRFRLNTKIGKIRPDIVLPKWRTAIFIHGCFWHGHANCHLYRLPKSRVDFWRTKIDVNKQRDGRAFELARQEGWNVITVWECALKGRTRLDVRTLLQQVSAAIGGPSAVHEITGINDRT